MGLLFKKLTNSIVVDACITDIGKQLLSRGIGLFNPTKWAPFDDVIDYSLWDLSNPGSPDNNILSIPMLESFIGENAVKFQLISSDTTELKYLPKIIIQPEQFIIYYKNLTVDPMKITISQKMMKPDLIIPSSMWDPSFIVELNDKILYIENSVVLNLTIGDVCSYIIPTESVGISNENKVTLNIKCREISQDMWDELGKGTSPNRQITTKIKFIGFTSGILRIAPFVLKESSIYV